MDRPVYAVTVQREEAWWVAIVEDVAGAAVEAKRLDQLEAELRDSMALLTDIAYNSFDLEWRYELPEPAASAISEFENARRERTAAEEHYQEATQEALDALNGFSVRDAGVLLKLSNQRISQLRANP